MLDRRQIMGGATAVAFAGLPLGAKAAASAAEGQLNAVLDEAARGARPSTSGWDPYSLSETTLPNLSFEYSQDSAAKTRGWIDRLNRLRGAPMSDDARETLDILHWDLSSGLEWQRHYWLDFPIGPYTSALSHLPDRLGAMSLPSTESLEVYLGLLEASPAYIDQISAKLKGQLERGVVQHQETIAAVATYVDALLADPAATFTPAAGRLSRIPPERAAAFRAKAASLATGSIAPALVRLSKVLREDYLPRAGDGVGLWRYPGGDEFYSFLLGFRLTRDLEPHDAHARALQSIADADRDLAAIRREIGFTGTAEAFHDDLLNGPRWRAANVEEVAKRFRAAMDRMRPHLPSLFSHMSPHPYDVAPQPRELEALFINGYYQRPTKDEPRGLYRFNGGDLANASWFWATPLVYHELVPGHHLQIDSIQASTTLSPYRKSFFTGGTIEGWAEYGRSLAGDVGLYDNDPLNRYAARLFDRRMAISTAVDTGMHAKRWSLDKGADWIATDAITRPPLRRRLALAYAVDFPGFGACYWAGGQEFRRLREATKARLGDRFDIRRFHEVILSAGAMPFATLEARLAKQLV